MKKAILKRISAIALALTFCLMLLPTGASAAVGDISAKLTASKTTVTAGETVDITFSITGTDNFDLIDGSGIGMWGALIDFDDSAFTYTSGSLVSGENTLTSGATYQCPYMSDNGRIYIGSEAGTFLTSASGGADNKIAMIKLTFTAKSATAKSYDFTCIQDASDITSVTTDDAATQDMTIGTDATVSVSLSAGTEITGVNPIANVNAGKVGAVTYADADAVKAALPTSANVTHSGGVAIVSVASWTDTDTYNPNVAGSYTFTGTLTMPAGYANTAGYTATVEVVVAEKSELTGFSAIANVDAGKAGAATYASAAAVQATLPTSATATYSGGTVSVPVSSWTDTDTYNPNTAGSYTFTAVLGTLPGGYANAGGYTATVEVVVAAKTEISFFETMANINGGKLGSATYADVAAVRMALPSTVQAGLSGGGYVLVNVDAWADTDAYKSNVAGSYTFDAILGTLPAGYANSGNYTATVEVVVSPADVEFTGFSTITNVDAGKAGAAIYATVALAQAALPTSVTATYSSGTVSVPVTSWTDSESYNPNVAGSYTFTAVLGTLPGGYANAGSYTATVEVVVGDAELTGFNAISNFNSGKAGAAIYANVTAVRAALPTNATATYFGGTVSVPVSSWTDSDSYNPNVAGSYTFTAVLGTLPTGYANAGGYTATLEVVVDAKTELTGFAAIGNVDAGKAGAATYANAAAVQAILPTTATATYSSGTVSVPVSSWTDTDSYNPSAAGSYTFTAVLGTLPGGYANAGSYTATVEVVVSAADVQLTGFSAISNVDAGKAGAATYANAAAVQAILPASAMATYSSGTVSVPVSSWTDTDTYNPNTAGSYTFTAVLATLPTGYANAGGYTATVEVVVSAADVQLTGFSAITNVDAGKAGSATYANAAAVKAVLPTSAMATYSSGTVSVPVTSWTDTDTYNPNTAGSYTFTAVLGTLPGGYANAGAYTATVEVVVAAKTELTGFSAISNVSAGKAGVATYANAAEVQAILPTSATATYSSGTVSVPVTSWTDTDTYNSNTAGSYTFTAVLGTLPGGYANAGSYTATVEVVVGAADIQITSVFAGITTINVGKAGATTCANAAAVQAILPTTVTANTNYGSVSVPVSSWTDTDTYNPNTAGSYTFTAVLGTLPGGYANAGAYTATVEVVVAAKTELTGFSAITSVDAGKVGAPTYANAAAVQAILPTSAMATYSSGTVSVPVTSWTDTDTYNPNTAGSYTFTAVLGTIPSGYANAGSYTATIEVVVAAKTELTGFSAISNVDAGKAGAATYANAAAVQAILPTSAMATYSSGTVSVPVSSWTDTDTYNPNTAGSYTFTAVLGTLPGGYANAGAYTATVEVVVAAETELTGFSTINNISAGNYSAPIYENASAVISYLNANYTAVTATYLGGTVSVPVYTWVYYDLFAADVPGSYTFLAQLGTIPAGYANSGNFTASVEVVVTDEVVIITGFEAIANIDAGNAGAATYADAAAVEAALPTTVTANTASGTLSIPVASWTDTDTYSASTAGSYTFTAVLGTIPAGVSNATGYTATVEVVVSAPDVQITGFDAISNVSAGKAGAATYANAAAVQAILPPSVTAALSGGGHMMLSVNSWTDTDSYNPNTAGSYTFTAVLETLPAGYANSGSYTATVEVVVSASDVQITGFSAITSVNAGPAGAATYADAAAVKAVLPTTVMATYSGGTVSVPVASWTDTDSYSASTAGSYTFTAVLGTIPTGYANSGSYTATVEVVVSAATSGGGGISAGSTTQVYDVSQKNNIISQIEGTLTTVEASMKSSTVVASEIFSALEKKADQTMAFDASDYKWLVNSSDISAPTAYASYDMGVTFKWELLKEITTVPTGANESDLAVELKINHSGALPGKMILQFGTDKVKKPYDGQDMYLYYINNGQYEYLGSVKVASDGTIELPFTHASEYLLTAKRILTDIDGNWAYDNIMSLVGLDVVNGYDGLYHPDSNVTRAEFAKMIATAFDYKANASLTAFSDVSSSDWYYEYVAALCKNGIMQGKGDGTFGASECLTREQMATTIYRVMQDKKYNLANSKNYTGLNDEATINSYALDAVKALFEKGIINGVGNNYFAPKTFASKAQVAAILDRLLTQIG